VTASPSTLRRFLADELGDDPPFSVTPMAGGGSCEVSAVDRGDARWVLRRAPRHASSASAHDVLREFRILDAIKDQPVRIARPVLACDRGAVFDAPFYLMERIDGVPIRASIPESWTTTPESQGRALEELVDALVEIHAVDWEACGLGDMAHDGDYLGKQLARWIDQLDSYQSRELHVARDIRTWLDAHRPLDQPPALCHGDYKLDNVLFAVDSPPQLLAVVDWEMAAIGDPIVDLAWALIFHPGPEGTVPLGRSKDPMFAVDQLPGRPQLIERYATRSGRDVGAIGWYDVFSRWKLAIVLEGSYAKFLRGQSDKPMHEFFGLQADRLLASAAEIIERRESR
jgi:aminoglycoside phosphotransferase (APT) family kinase protein